MTEHEMETRSETSDLSAGRWLGQARKEHNLTVADVAAKLRLAPRQIEAIEADDYVRLPGKTIVRGFVRNYARLLQLDPAQVVAAYDRTAPGGDDQRISVPHQNVQFSEVASGHRNRMVLWLTLGLGILVVLGFLAWWREAAIATAPKPTTSDVTIPNIADGGPAAADSSTTAPSTVSEPASAVVVPEASSVPPPTDPVPVAITENVVHLAFAGASRVEVRDAGGKVVWKKTNPAGSEQDITAPLPLSFTIGNAAKVKMTHNGDAFDLAPHTSGSIARFKLER
jgi:cytoskeleton protein RodZ